MHAQSVQLLAVCLVSAVVVCSSGPLGENAERHRSKRAAPTLADRTACTLGSVPPAIRVDTTQRLVDIRAAMASTVPPVHAFIVLSDDAHGSEYPADSDKRRGFISGFSGSAGTAVVTMSQAALWTDGRYFLEAEDALDCNWLLMKSGETDVPTITEWLGQVLNAGESVGADPFLIPNSNWLSYETALKKHNITLERVTENPVDIAWGAAKPQPPKSNVTVLQHSYVGRTWSEKVTAVRDDMRQREIYGAVVITALDEIAWLFNLRASDIQYNPFFLAYAIIEVDQDPAVLGKTRLYIYDKDNRLTMTPSDPEASNNTQLYVHLHTGTDGTCGASGSCVEVREYDNAAILSDVATLASDATKKIVVTYLCNYAIYGTIPEAQRVQERSTIALAKAQKNANERRGMENCYNRDSAVLVEFLAMLERDVKGGTKDWTEVSAALHLKNMRMAAPLNRGLSFGSISGSGPNGAIIHYRPANNTDRPITTSEMYLLDSGGQYLDGTTDVTRTMHYGQPNAYEIECYTRVLLGSIDLALMVWPEGLYGREIDMAARAPLWSVGLEYRHGTGHGIGAWLSVHEGPGRISLTHSANPSEETLHSYMYFSDEPGFYEPGKFGIRLETVVMVEPTNTTHKFGDKQFLRFKPITLVPFERNLIDYSLLNQRQIDWLNTYHDLTQRTIEPHLKTDLAKNWLKERTRAYDSNRTSASPGLFVSMATVVVAAAVTFIFA